MSNISNQKSSLCPAYVPLDTFLPACSFFLFSNGRQTVGDGAFTFDAQPSVLAVCHMQGNDDMHYYSTTFSGGPGVSSPTPYPSHLLILHFSGAFDAPKAKCPPDRGSSDCVTGSQASFLPYHFSDSPSSSLSSSPISNHSSTSSDSPRSLFNYPISRPPATSPRNIPSRSISSLSTPPLTPDHLSDPSKGSWGYLDKSQKKDALDFLMTVFPHHGLSALPYAKSVSISAPNLGADFEGVVLEMPGSLKTLYVDGKSAESVSLRERYFERLPYSGS